MRITQKTLETMVQDLNVSAKLQNYLTTKTGEGSYFLDMAYGGYKLCKYTTGTACKEISKDGFGTTTQLYSFLCGYVHPVKA